jgi:hypothetical protein
MKPSFQKRNFQLDSRFFLIIWIILSLTSCAEVSTPKTPNAYIFDDQQSKEIDYKIFEKTNIENYKNILCIVVITEIETRQHSKNYILDSFKNMGIFNHIYEYNNPQADDNREISKDLSNILRPEGMQAFRTKHGKYLIAHLSSIRVGRFEEFTSLKIINPDNGKILLQAENTSSLSGYKPLINGFMHWIKSTQNYD